MSGAFTPSTFDEYAFDVDYSASPALFVSIDGVQRATGRADENSKIAYGSLQVVDVLNETPNTCRFRTIGFAPTVGQRVLVSLGGATNPSRLFAGTVITVRHTYQTGPGLPSYEVVCADDTWKLGLIKVTTRYTAMSATDIAIDLIDTYASDFSTDGVEADLPEIDEITFTNETLADCLSRLAKRIGGYWRPGEFEDVWFFITEPDGDDPPDITDDEPPLQQPAVAVERDLSQMITRVTGEGDGSTVLSDVAVGETLLPVQSIEKFNPNGGTFVSGPQRVDYTGVEAGGIVGSLVGTGAAPTTPPIAALAAGVGIEDGDHDYAYTFVTGAGESIPSPLETIEVGPVPAPETGPTAALATGTGMTSGNHYFAVTFETATGETTSSPVSGTVTTGPVTTGVIAAPSTMPIVTPIVTSGNITPGDYAWVVTFVNAAGETTQGPAYNRTVAAGEEQMSLTSIPIGPSGTTARRIYRNTAAAPGILKLVTTIANNTATTYTDNVADGSLGATVPSSNTTGTTTNYNRVDLTSIPLGPPATTARNIYGTAAGGSQLKFIATIADNSTTTYQVTTADGSLGANIPVVNDATANRVDLTGIAVGPSGTTSRKVYRTEANLTQLKLLTTIADNSTTTYADSTADGSLGANAPTSDTSGLTQPEGQVLPGATSIPVASTSLLPSAGWAVIGNGQQVVRYTGKTGSTLTGVPASGAGAVTSVVNFNSSITAAPILTGIPSSSTGSILFAIVKGDPANLFIVEDDLAAQAVVANAIGNGHSGIIEEHIQDRRMTETEIRARARAVLAQRALIQASISYAVGNGVDPLVRNTRSGRTITADLSALSVDESFKIQQVTISNFHPALEPLFTVQASTNRFSFEDLLRMARGG